MGKELQRAADMAANAVNNALVQVILDQKIREEGGGLYIGAGIREYWLRSFGRLYGQEKDSKLIWDLLKELDSQYRAIENELPGRNP